MDSHFTSSQVAKLFQVSVKTIYKWTQDGYMKTYRMPGSAFRRYRRSDLIKFAKEHELPVPAGLLDTPEPAAKNGV